MIRFISGAARCGRCAPVGPGDPPSLDPPSGCLIAPMSAVPPTSMLTSEAVPVCASPDGTASALRTVTSAKNDAMTSLPATTAVFTCTPPPPRIGAAGFNPCYDLSLFSALLNVALRTSELRRWQAFGEGRVTDAGYRRKFETMIGCKPAERRLGRSIPGLRPRKRCVRGPWGCGFPPPNGAATLFVDRCPPRGRDRGRGAHEGVRRQPRGEGPRQRDVPGPPEECVRVPRPQRRGEDDDDPNPGDGPRAHRGHNPNRRPRPAQGVPQGEGAAGPHARRGALLPDAHGAPAPRVLRFLLRDPAVRSAEARARSPRAGRARARVGQEGEGVQPRDAEATVPRPVPPQRPRRDDHGRARERAGPAGDAVLPRPHPLARPAGEDDLPVVPHAERGGAALRARGDHRPRQDCGGGHDREPERPPLRGGPGRPPRHGHGHHGGGAPGGRGDPRSDGRPADADGRRRHHAARLGRECGGQPRPRLRGRTAARTDDGPAVPRGPVPHPDEGGRRVKLPGFLRGMPQVAWQEFLVNLKSVRLIIMGLLSALLIVGGAYGFTTLFSSGGGFGGLPPVVAWGHQAYASNGSHVAVVWVSDPYGAPVAGRSVEFTNRSPTGGEVALGTIPTDANGFARLDVGNSDYVSATVRAGTFTVGTGVVFYPPFVNFTTASLQGDFKRHGRSDGLALHVMDLRGNPAAANVSVNGTLTGSVNGYGYLLVDLPVEQSNVTVEVAGEAETFPTYVPGDSDGAPFTSGPDFVLVVIASLSFLVISIFAIVLSFDAVSKERVQGTMDLLLSRPTSRTRNDRLA